MIETEPGDAAPRYHVIRTNYRSYELWIADRVAVFDNRADLNKWVELLKTGRAP